MLLFEGLMFVFSRSINIPPTLFFVLSRPFWFWCRSDPKISWWSWYSFSFFRNLFHSLPLSTKLKKETELLDKIKERIELGTSSSSMSFLLFLFLELCSTCGPQLCSLPLVKILWPLEYIIPVAANFISFSNSNCISNSNLFLIIKNQTEQGTLSCNHSVVSNLGGC